jgi:inositol-phosphate phosphatase / L-galactose 1-phosphate phosphatase / histidinol-phosphatase
MPTSIEHVRTIAEQIAQRASAIPMEYFGAQLEVIAKSDESPVTIADRKTEKFIRKELAHHFPTHGILGEEFGVSGSLQGETWIIDPIDGTRSFITGNPLFGMLLGYLVEGTPNLGLVRMPALNETYVGIPGRGAFRNGEEIFCRTTTEMSQAKIYINEAERLHEAKPQLFTRLCKVGHTRRMAYDCYPHAMLAAGLIDCVVDYGLEPYDFLPLVGLIEAAGGVITDWAGNALNLDSDGKVLSSATTELHSQMLAILNA